MSADADAEWALLEVTRETAEQHPQLSPPLGEALEWLVNAGWGSNTAGRAQRPVVAEASVWRQRRR